MKRIFFLFQFFIFWRFSLSQNLPVVVPPSPNVAAVQQYGDYPVNYFTGVPDISIPIYVIKSKQLSIPVTLSYHASGIKVTDVATWVGLGWSLNIGGQISRKVMGIPDETSAGILQYPIRSASTVHESTDQVWLAQVNMKAVDQESDIFSYDFPGKSGKFVFNNTGSGLKTFLIPYEPLNISYTQGLGSFTILDEFGNIYEFAKNEVTNNASNGVPGILQSVRTAWLMTKMKDANSQDSINLSYTQKEGETFYDYMDNCSVTDYNRNINTSCSYSYQTIITNEQQLTTVTYSLGKVEFITDATQYREDKIWDRRLKSIKIYSLQAGDVYRLEQTVEFIHSYFSAGTGYLNKRLRLDAVKFYDRNNIQIKNYSFNYNTDTNLPSRTSRSRDYWGYFNNKENSDLIPYQSILIYNEGGIPSNGSVGHANRTSDFTYMQANVLNRINYPTGGYTDFTYEANKYDSSGTSKTGGGLRIYQIKSYAESGANPIVKTYKYGNSETGNGRLNAILAMSCFWDEMTFEWMPNQYACAEGRTRTFMSNSSIDIFPWDGSPVFYETVTEYIGTPTLNTGKTIYKYYDRVDGYDAMIGQGEKIRVSYHWQ